MGLQQEKKARREKLKKLLASSSVEQRSDWSKKLSIRLREFFDDNFKEVFASDSNLRFGCFAPISFEPHWHLEMDNWLSKTAFCDLRAEKMVFVDSRFDDLEETKVFSAPVPTPPRDHLVVAVNHILVPGLGFSRSGERLGRGRGFYDRTLKEDWIKIGVCFDFQVEDSLPVENHDQRVDYIITEKQLIKTRKQ